MAEEERRNSMEREVSGVCSSSSGAGEPSSSLASSSVAVAGEESDAQERQGRNVGESAAAAEQSSSPVRESVPTDQSIEDVKWRNMDSVVNELLFLAQKLPPRSQGDDGGGSQNNITSDDSTAGGGGEVIVKDGLNEAANISVVAAGAGAEAAVIVAACNGTVSEGKKKRKRSKKNQSSSSSSSSSAHTCEVCGKTYATGQSLGGHKRKHYEGQLIIKKKRAREEREQKPSPAAERRVQAPVMAAAEGRMASSCNAPFKSHDRALLPQALLSQSVQGDCGRRSAADGARRRPHDFDLNEPGLPEPEWKDHDGDEALLSFRLGQFDFQRSN